MPVETTFKLFASSALLVSGWFLRELWTAVQNLKEDLGVLEKELPVKFVQKEDYKVDISRILETLNKIYDKLDNKVDRKPS